MLGFLLIELAGAMYAVRWRSRAPPDWSKVSPSNLVAEVEAALRDPLRDIETHWQLSEAIRTQQKQNRCSGASVHGNALMEFIASKPKAVAAGLLSRDFWSGSGVYQHVNVTSIQRRYPTATILVGYLLVVTAVAPYFYLPSWRPLLMSTATIMISAPMFYMGARGLCLAAAERAVLAEADLRRARSLLDRW